MKRLWAPWRIEYITGEPEEDCLFCGAFADEDDRKRLVVHRGKAAFAMLNKYPYIGGHLLIVPARHVPELKDLMPDERAELFDMTTDSVEALKRAMKPHGFNIGVNIGRVAGAGVPDHVHVHVVPRWNGDNNFMAVLGDTRMINEHLERTYEKLRAKWRKNASRY